VERVDRERLLFSCTKAGIARSLCEQDLDLALAVECADTERMLFSPRTKVGLVRLLCELGTDLVGDETSSSSSDSPDRLLPKRMACMVDGTSHFSFTLIPLAPKTAANECPPLR
jgi:hypothetical protein